MGRLAAVRTTEANRRLADPGKAAAAKHSQLESTREAFIAFWSHVTKIQRSVEGLRMDEAVKYIEQLLKHAESFASSADELITSARALDCLPKPQAAQQQQQLAQEEGAGEAQEGEVSPPVLLPPAGAAPLSRWIDARLYLLALAALLTALLLKLLRKKKTKAKIN